MSHKLDQLNRQQKRTQQQQQMAELGEVSRGLAHTLRNPINTIGLSIEQLMQQGISDEQKQKLANNAQQKISLIDNTIKALLSLTDHQNVQKSDIRVIDVIQDIALEMSITHGIQISIKGDADVYVHASEAVLRSVIHTIVVNSVEACLGYVPKQQIKIVISIEQQAQEVQIEVSDNGPGLDQKVRDIIFAPHVTTKAEGAGMGLYIARRLTQTHFDGEIQLQNNSPTGCIANITLLKEQGDNQ